MLRSRPLPHQRNHFLRYLDSLACVYFETLVTCYNVIFYKFEALFQLRIGPYMDKIIRFFRETRYFY